MCICIKCLTRRLTCSMRLNKLANGGVKKKLAMKSLLTSFPVDRLCEHCVDAGMLSALNCSNTFTGFDYRTCFEMSIHLHLLIVSVFIKHTV